MRAPARPVADLVEALALLRAVGARSVVFDVEPLAGARKPFAIAAYRGLPPLGVLVGDQVATDGVLALRLGFAFAHLQHGDGGVPLGPRLMGLLGGMIAPLVLRRGQ